MYKKKTTFHLILVLLSFVNFSIASSEKNCIYPSYKNLKPIQCYYKYKFSENRTISQKSPIYLETRLFKICKLSNYSVSVITAYPYIYQKGKRKVYFCKEGVNLSLRENENLPKIKFSFRIYLYGESSKKKITAHIYDMKKADHGFWSGAFRDLNVVVKKRGQPLMIKKRKWIKDITGDNFFALALLTNNAFHFPEKNYKPALRPVKSRKTIEKFEEILITHEKGIAFLKDIWLKGQHKISIKKDISHKPGKERNQYIIIPFSKDILEEEAIIQIVLFSKETKKFSVFLQPGAKIPIDNNELAVKKD